MIINRIIETLHWLITNELALFAIGLGLGYFLGKK